MKINILHIVPSLSAGGVESLVVSLWENIDRNKFHFLIAVLNPYDPIHKEKFEVLGAEVFFISTAGNKRSLISKFTWRLTAIYNYIKLISEKDIHVLHCHYYNPYGPFVFFAALKGIPVRIVQSHTVGMYNNLISRFCMTLFNKLNLSFLVTAKIGCSNAAVKWFYGNSLLKKGKAKAIYNGVDMRKFSRINNSEKQKIRNAYEMNRGIHFIHVGRFTTDKNQLFLIKLFYEMTLKENNLNLNIIGYGPEEMKIKELISELKIEKQVRFYSSDSNVPEILCAMDYFLLPSHKEGLSIVAIESQCSGIPIFISGNVTREVDMGLAIYLPIDQGPKMWATKILKMIEMDTIPKEINLDKLKQFDIKNTAFQFEELYRSKTIMTNEEKDNVKNILIEASGV